MMKKEVGRLPPRDLEALSVYLDGELTPRERVKLEARLEANPELRQALEELRLVAGALRELPQASPGRRFTLTPEMARRRRRYPTMQLATALAGVAFLLTVGVDALLVARPRAASERPAQLAAPPEALFMEQDQLWGATEVPPEEAEVPALPATGSAGEGLEGEVVEEGRLAGGPLATPTMSVGAAEKAVGTEVAGTPVAAPEALAAAPPVEETPVAALSDEEQAETELSPAPLPSPTVRFGAGGEFNTEAARSATTEAPRFPWLRVLEFFLAGLTLLLGGLTLVQRRR